MSKYGLVVLAWLALTAAGCSPGSTPSDISGYDAVVTLYDNKADFPSAFTFVLVDTVMHIVGDGGTDGISRRYDETILSQLRANMLAVGWTEITAPDSTHAPDVALQVGVTTSDYVSFDYWPPVWGTTPGWGYPGYGWGWGSYPAYSYTTGTIVMAMLDVRHPNPDTQTLPIMWIGAVSGVASSTSSNMTRIVSGIDQAFAQSPYLRK